MKKFLLLTVIGLMNMATVGAYSLTQTDNQIIEVVETKVSDWTQTKMAKVYNTLNAYLLTTNDTNGRGYVLFSRIYPIVYDELSKGKEHDTVKNLDISIAKIEAKNRQIQVLVCSSQREYEGFVNVTMTSPVASKTTRYYLHPNIYDNNTCQTMIFSQSIFTNKTSETVVITAEIELAQASDGDIDTTNNRETASLMIGKTSTSSANLKGASDLYIKKIALYPQTDDVIMTVCMDGSYNSMVTTRVYSNNRMFNVQRYEINDSNDEYCFEYYVDGFQFLFVPGRTYVFEARVDPYNKYHEVNETNNYMKTTLFIPAFIPFADGMIAPDFLINEITYNDKTNEITVEICHEG